MNRDRDNHLLWPLAFVGMTAGTMLGLIWGGWGWGFAACGVGVGMTVARVMANRAARPSN